MWSSTGWKILAVLVIVLLVEAVTVFTYAGNGFDLTVIYILSLCISLPLIWFSLRRFSLFMDQLKSKLNALRNGNYDVRLELSSSDEFGELAHEFNDLKDSIYGRFNVLTDEQQKLESILDEFTQGIVAVNSEETLIYMNPRARYLLDAEDENVGDRPLWEVTQEDEIIEAVSHTLSTGDDTQSEVTIHETPEERILNINASPLTKNDSIIGAVVALNDITELRHLQTVRQDFVANVSHELKTPITAIQGLVETLTDDGEMEKEIRQRFLSKIENQTIRMRELVEDLMTISRLESPDTSPDFDRIDLRSVFKDSRETFKTLAEEKNHSLDIEIPDKPVQINGDVDSLRQLVGNLLDNAIKYTSEGGEINVKLSADDGTAKMIFEDNGYGIEPREQDRIFERFYRVDDGRSREEGGTGLGLSIVKHVILSHGGDIEIDSTPGHGTTFIISIPIDQ